MESHGPSVGRKKVAGKSETVGDSDFLPFYPRYGTPSYLTGRNSNRREPIGINRNAIEGLTIRGLLPRAAPDDDVLGQRLPT